MRNRLVKRERWGENVDMTVVCADHDAVAANRRIVFRRCWEIRKPRCAARPDGEGLAMLAAPHAPPPMPRPERAGPWLRPAQRRLWCQNRSSWFRMNRVMSVDFGR